MHDETQGQSPREVLWERMFPDELERAFAERPLIWLGQGLCEPHGPQCALGLDALKAEGLVVRAARAHGGIVAPTMRWHMHELTLSADWGHQAAGPVARTWLTAVPPWHYFKTLCYHVRQMEVLGFHAAIFVTGHYGPAWSDMATILSWLQPYCACRLRGLPDSAVNKPGFSPERPGRSGDHAGQVETSQLWAMEPDCVDMSRLPSPDTPGPHMCMGDTAHQADRRVGERMVADQVAALGRIAAEVEADWTGRRERDDAGLTTYSDVERVWHDEIRPRLHELLIMQDDWAHVGIPRCPPDSPWAANRDLPDLIGNGWG